MLAACDRKKRLMRLRLEEVESGDDICITTFSSVWARLCEHTIFFLSKISNSMCVHFCQLREQSCTSLTIFTGISCVCSSMLKCQSASDRLSTLLPWKPWHVKGWRRKMATESMDKLQAVSFVWLQYTNSIYICRANCVWNKWLQILGSELPCHFPTLWSILKAILTIRKVWEPSTSRIGRNAFNVSPGRSGKELVLPGGAVGNWWLRLGKIVVELTGDFTPDVRSSGTREDKGCYRNFRYHLNILRLGIHSRYLYMKMYVKMKRCTVWNML